MEVPRKIHERCVKSLIDVIVLEMINREPMSGYDIIALIHKEFRILLSPGTVYPLLNFLERNGLIKGKQVQRKKVYTLTTRGKSAIKLLVKVYTDILKEVSE